MSQLDNYPQRNVRNGHLLPAKGVNARAWELMWGYRRAKRVTLCRWNRRNPSQRTSINTVITFVY